MSNKNQSEECCPKFNPVLWDDKIFQWDNKKFIKDKVLTLLFMPINFGSVVKRMMVKIEKAGAEAQDWMCLSDHTSKWNMNLYMAVDREIPGVENITFSENFLSKAYEGNFKETGKWCKDFESYAKGKNLEVKKWYMWYTTCPKCAKKYGKNYVAIIAEVK
jgi:hypothetical protein